MENASRAGFNRTGVQTAPLTVQHLQAYADEQTSSELPKDGVLDGTAIAAVRAGYVQEAGRIGSVPMPGALPGAVTGSPLGARRPEVLVDKLGERLAFERSGVRFYQALIDKTEAMGGAVEIPFAADDLRRIRDEEFEHMHIVISALDGLGADPTAQTPSADVAGVANSGVMQVLTDPRTTLPHCLEALLGAELIDGASWELLIRLATEAGQHDLVAPFGKALRHENEHVARIKGWLEQMVVGELG